MENLSQRFLAWVTNRQLDSYIIEGAQSISHLIFVDDVLIFTKANKKSLETLRSILKSFSSYSGLNINQQTNASYFLKSVQSRQDLPSILNFPSKELPITHLEIPLVGRELREKDYEPLVNQLQNYLNS